MIPPGRLVLTLSSDETGEATPSRRFHMQVSYDGTDFCGWQRQPNADTVQEQLETALRKVLRHQVTVFGASRTDAGVHAQGQHITFDTTCPIPAPGLLLATNSYLPKSIQVVSSRIAPTDFHARFSSIGKHYAYRVWRRSIQTPFGHRYSWMWPHDLDEQRIQKACEVFIGEHDFHGFRATDCGAKTSIRTIHRIDIEPIPPWNSNPKTSGDYLTIHIMGNAFLRNMVRIIVGTILEVACGKMSVDDARTALRSRHRPHAGITAPAQGLCLVNVFYRHQDAPWNQKESSISTNAP